MLKSVSVLLALIAICAASDYSSLADLNIEPLIVNGKPSARGQFPFYALVLANLNGGRAACGGNLIASQWVLTAAHCVIGARSFEIHLGALNLTDFNETGRVIVGANRSFPHPGYEPTFVRNDIALIQLEKPVELNNETKTIQTIRLDEENLRPNTTLTAVGFGLQNTTDTSLAPILQYASVQTISQLQCARTFPFLLFRSSVVCTVGSNFESPCNGDSGGPLIRPNPRDPQAAPSLVGLTSFGTGECHTGQPAAYTRVSSFVEWIRLTIRFNSN